MKKTTSTAIVLSFLALFLVTTYNACSSSGGGSGGGGPATTSLTRWSGTKQLGVHGSFTQANSVIVDSQGGVIETGYTTGGLDGNAVIGVQDCFVTKYSSVGAKLWTRQMGGVALTTECTNLTADSSNNVYVVGYTNGGLDGNSVIGNVDYFVTKYDATGDKQWTHQFGVAGSNTYGYGIALDSSGNIYVGGQTSGAITGAAATGSYDSFLIKYDATWALQWSRHVGAAGGTAGAFAVATDSLGNVFIAGQTDAGLHGITLTGTLDAFIIKYSVGGNFLWIKEFGAATFATHCNGIATDSAGDAILTGYTYGGLYGNSHISGTGADLYVVKWTTAGTLSWANQLGIAGAETRGYGVTTDSSADIFATGYTTGNLDGNTLTGSSDMFVTRYNASGTKQWTSQLGAASSAMTSGSNVAADAAGDVFVAGSTNGDLDGNTVTGTFDTFISKFNSSGLKQ